MTRSADDRRGLPFGSPAVAGLVVCDARVPGSIAGDRRRHPSGNLRLAFSLRSIHIYWSDSVGFSRIRFGSGSIGSPVRLPLVALGDLSGRPPGSRGEKWVRLAKIAQAPFLMARLAAVRAPRVQGEGPGERRTLPGRSVDAGKENG